MEERFVAYYRVSTQQQGRSGLGLDAQRHAVAGYVAGRAYRLMGEYTEVETGKGSNALDRRPELRAALDACKRHKATLLIAKLDRLARNVHFVSGLLEARVNFVAVDMPNADRTMMQIYSVMAEFEARQISARTKAALAQAKARGVVLGRAGLANLRTYHAVQQAAARAFVEDVRGHFQVFRERGLTQRQMVAELNAHGVAAPRGGAWRLNQVQRALRTLATLQPAA